MKKKVKICHFISSTPAELHLPETYCFYINFIFLKFNFE